MGPAADDFLAQYVWGGPKGKWFSYKRELRDGDRIVATMGRVSKSMPLTLGYGPTARHLRLERAAFSDDYVARSEGGDVVATVLQRQGLQEFGKRAARIMWPDGWELECTATGITRPVTELQDDQGTVLWILPDRGWRALSVMVVRPGLDEDQVAVMVALAQAFELNLATSFNPFQFFAP
jgi:hypothetical protein